MGRRNSVDNDELLRRLGGVFRDGGYEGATLAALSEASGLQKASLYHRFPGGKEQMAQEVLQHTSDWLETQLLAPLRSVALPPATRITRMVRCLDELYSGGEQDCLLNALSLGRRAGSSFGAPISTLISAWVDTLSAVLREAGLTRARARRRAERALIGIQGSLVISRGLGTTRPFKEFLGTLPHELLDGCQSGTKGSSVRSAMRT